MEKLCKSKFLALVLCIMMVLSVLPAGVMADEGGLLPEWDVSKSKEATNLDSNYESEVTLSLPSAEETLESDIVFVLDKSTSADVENEALTMLSQLKEMNASVKVGVVIFNKIANVQSELVDLATNYGEIEKAIKSEIKSGSNTHAGLLAGKQLLDSDPTVPAERKYLIFVSDGVTYQFCRDNDYSKAYTRSFDGSLLEGVNQCGTLSELNVQYGNEYANGEIPNGNIDNWLMIIDNKYNTDDGKYDYEYTGSAPTDESKLMPSKECLSNVEKALYLTKKTYESIEDAGYRCFSILTKNTYQFGTDFMNKLAGGKTLEFSEVSGNILYLIGSGSTVTDVMGEEVDFINSADRIYITIDDGTDVIETIKATETEKNKYSFNGQNGEFELVYDPDADSFVWTINCNISNYKHTKLHYAVKLSNPSRVAGTYGIYDRFGKNKYNSILTNESAVLTPKDSNGKSGAPEDFNRPTVSYTVEDDTPIIPIIPIINFVDVTVRKVDADDHDIVLSGAVFDLYRDGMERPYMTGLTTDENGEILLRDLNENTTYYLVETSAPEGYKLSDTKKEFTTGNTDSTVYFENVKSEAPSVLESGDHFAYIVGYPDGNVRPTGNITRAEVATIFFRLLTEEARTANMTQENPFSDVNKGDWYNCAISTLHAMGIVNGYTDGTFNPNGFITRAEFAAIAARFDSIGNDFKQSFDDVYGHWAEDEIAAAQAHGWLKGYEDGTFKPDQLITRAEAMTIVNRVLVRLPESADALRADMVVWPDNADTTAWYYLAVQEATNSHYYERNTETTEYWTEIRAPRDWTLLEK